MQHLFRKLKLSAIFMFAILAYSLQTQAQVMDPSDPIVIYNPNNPPAQPPWGQMAKWVKTNRLNWNTSNYKCYIYKGLQFRLRFPKTYQHNVNDGKKYPIFVFFHGIGEKGSIYDNEFQLYHGGQLHDQAVTNGSFDGFLLYTQTQSGWFGASSYEVIKEIIENFLVPQNKGDINRVLVDGLSGGGSACWEFSIAYPNLVAASTPISSASLSFGNSANSLKWIPTWHFQGGLDHAPDPGTSEALGATLLNAGANYRYTKYPTRGHGCWYNAWAEPDYFPFLSRAHKANPWVLGGQTEFCPNVAINATIGVSSGFDEYQWKRNGSVYGGNTNQITVTTTGIYECRFRRGAEWSVWSPTPIEIKIKAPTVSPPIQITGLKSRLIPAPDGSTSVPLEVPAGYASYLWQKEGNGTTLSTTRTLNANSPGNYKVKVTELYGCSSDFSDPFTVIDANGPNKPDPAINPIVSPLSKTQLKIDWSDNPTPLNDETNFEIYQATQAGGPYSLIALTGANVLTYTQNGLNANSTYYYIVRAINNTAAAAVSVEANGTTLVDDQAPTAPANLTITATTRSTVSLHWDAATDDVGVAKYDVYIDGVKSYVTTQTQFTIYNLVNGKTYNFTVKARDLANNASPFSNQVTGQPLLSGIPYKYYTFTGTWQNLPDFTTLTPVSMGIMPNVALTPRSQDDNFAFLWEGQIIIPVSGTYYFRTNSDDGSRLWLGSLNGSTSPYSFSGTPLVNNDGLHGTKDATSSAISLTAGVYPIAMAFYEQGGGQAMTVSWSIPGSGGSFVAIPNSAFADAPSIPGTPPSDPSGVTATAVSYKTINVEWSDNSNNETGFEIWRSTQANAGFTTIGIADADATLYMDSTLAPNTTYYYQIRAIGQYGESALVGGSGNVVQANWRFNNNNDDASGNNHTLSPNNSPIFSTDKQEGSHSVDLNGSNQDMTVNTSSGDYLRGGYTHKTVAFWMKSDNPGNNDGVFDFGGSDDGLAIRTNSNKLYAGIARSSTRRNISANYSSTGWNHIALVYNSNTLKLYVNATEVAANNSLPFTSVGTTSSGSMIGDDNGSNALNTSFGQFDGKLDNLFVIDKAFSVAEITKLMNDQPLSQNFATTLPAPTPPNTPTSLLAAGISNSKINISWTDVSDETAYELYRSSNNNSNYLLVGTLAANTVSYIDSGLFANSIHYYKIRAKNAGGASVFSNEDSAKTVNNLPVLGLIQTQYMRFGTVLQVNVSATDTDPEVLSIQTQNLPSFGSYSSTGNGTGTITFTNPAVQGTYGNIEVTVTDQQGGSHTIQFDLIVNDNYLPIIADVNNVVLSELQSTQVNISATDQNPADVLTWSFNGLPSFATPVINGNSVQLALTPGYADNGTYPVTAMVDDGNNGTDFKVFTITINNVNPNKNIYVNFTDGTYTSGAPWNNTNDVPGENDNYTNLLDDEGANSGLGILITSPWQNLGNGTNNYGVNTGNNSGIYPDNVIRSAYYTNASVQTMRLHGLNVANKYKITFFGSRGSVSDDRTTVYTINGNSVSLNAANNSQNTVNLDNLQPNPDGTLDISVAKGASAAYGYLNAMVIQSVYDDGTAPAKPRNLVGVYVSGTIELNWVDAAYNETVYEVYRSTTNTPGSFTLINPGGNNPDLQHFEDANILGNTTYFYYVIATNNIGSSPASDIVEITAPNGSPVITTIADVNMKTQEIVDVNVNAADGPGETISLQVSGLPSFASFVDNGNGTGVIHIAPGNTTGTFSSITVIATDNHGASSNKQFEIVVTDKDITSYYVNFNQVLPVGLPWNSFNNSPSAGRLLSNITDDAGNASGINVTLVDGWDGANDAGVSTGNNSGVYPDDVMKSAYYTSATGTKRIRITGLATGSTKYNLVLFASRGGVNDTRNTTYSSNGQSVTLNASGNSSNTVQLQGLTADVNGTIEFTAQKASSSAYGYINALVIQSYIDNGIPLAPSNLVAAPQSSTAIQLTWVDKSNNENNFEIYRSLSSEGTYSLLTTTGANITSYTDNGLTTGTIYFYKVRAKKAPVFYSSYSNIASASTITFSVYTNFNRDNPAAAPWNNTNTVPQLNDVFTNLLNSDNNPSGINLEVTKNFSGENPFGMNTGNNSGVYPDNVMRSSWWLDVGETAQLKVSGLNQSLAYSFVFFSSRDGGGNRTTKFTVNGTSVTLNAAYNTTQTVRIDNIKADGDGNALIDISVPPGSQFGYINSLVIQGYQASEDLQGNNFIVNGRVAPGTNERLNGNVVTTQDTTLTLASEWIVARPANENNIIVIDKIGVYPNPFKDQITVTANFANKQDKVVVKMIDMNGKVLLKYKFSGLPKGNWSNRFFLSGTINPGVYLIQVITGDGLPPQVFKIVKTK